MMKKLITTYLFAIGIAVIFAACNRNNGDIGDLFGEWRLESMTADGEPVQLYSKKDDASIPILFTWAFQGNVVRINSIYPNSHITECYGTWKRDFDNNILELKFIYKDSKEDTKYLYTPHEMLCLSPDGITRLDIVRFRNKKLEVKYVAPDGIEYSYYLTHPH